MKIINTIKSFFSSLKDKNTKRNKEITIQEITDRFNVSEKNESLYITCGSNAVCKLDDNITAKEIIKTIMSMRKDALSYKNIK